MTIISSANNTVIRFIKLDRVGTFMTNVITGIENHVFVYAFLSLPIITRINETIGNNREADNRTPQNQTV